MCVCVCVCACVCGCLSVCVLLLLSSLSQRVHIPSIMRQDRGPILSYLSGEADAYNKDETMLVVVVVVCWCGGVVMVLVVV